MSELKFTPGPWNIGTPTPNGQQTIGATYGLMVSVATTGMGMAEETMANAHLIASAPDMYQALSMSLLCLKDDSHMRRFPVVFALIESALKKARGEK